MVISADQVSGDEQILPRLAFLARRSQQVGRMIRDHDRNRLRAVFVDAPAHAANRRIDLQEVLGRDASDGEKRVGFEQCYLALQISAAGKGLLGVRIAVPWRPLTWRIFADSITSGGNSSSSNSGAEPA